MTGKSWMMSIWPFDVNDADNRKNFLYGHLVTVVGNLTEQHRPLWGKMTARQMVEHLAATFGISMGNGEIELPMKPELSEKRKKFLYNNLPTPHEVTNPLMEEKRIVLRFDHLDEAKQALAASVNKFRESMNADPGAIHFHPIFGFLNMSDWERAHYKHCYHHLLQFGLIRPSD